MRMRLAWKHSEGAGYHRRVVLSFVCKSQSHHGCWIRPEDFFESQNRKWYVQKIHILKMVYSEQILLQLTLFVQ